MFLVPIKLKNYGFGPFLWFSTHQNLKSLFSVPSNHFRADKQFEGNIVDFGNRLLQPSFLW